MIARGIIAVALTALVALPGWVAAQCDPCDHADNSVPVPNSIGQPENFAPRRAGVEVDARWRIPVSEDGWYRLTRTQLVAAGLPTNELTGAALRLFQRTNEVALLVPGDGLLQADDSVYFYGRRHDGPYNRTNVYWLGVGGTGLRIPSVDGAEIGGETVVTSACYSAVVDTKSLYRPFHQPLDDSIDHWFAALVNTSSDTTFSLNTSNRVLGTTARATLRMYGLTTDLSVNPDHRTSIKLNGHEIGFPTYDGTTQFVAVINMSATNLNGAMSALTLRQNADGVDADAAYLIDFRLDYTARIALRAPSSEFCGATGTNRYLMFGITTNAGGWILDVTDPDRPVRITNETYAVTVAPFFNVRFTYAAAHRPRLAVVMPNGVKAAPTPQPVIFRDLADAARQADYLMVTPTALRQPAYTLAKQRLTNGLSVVIAPVDDVYNEFGYGIVDPEAIKQFIGFAYHHWQAPAPRFALLVGEGTFDPLGHLGPPPTRHLPVVIQPSPFAKAASDMWYGLVDGSDLLPDVMIGRIATGQLAPFTNAVKKIIAHDRGSVGLNTTNALLVADNFDGVRNFEGSSVTNVQSYLQTSGYALALAYPSSPGGLAGARTTINNSFGRRLVSYVGHGANDRWSGVNIWNTNDVVNQVNTIYPLVTIFSCQNANFIGGETNGLAQAMLEAPRSAATVFGPSALSVQQYSDLIAAGFMNSLAVQKRRYLGDIAFEGFLNLFTFNQDIAELRTYSIIGDPGLIVNRPGTLPP